MSSGSIFTSTIDALTAAANVVVGGFGQPTPPTQTNQQSKRQDLPTSFCVAQLTDSEMDVSGAFWKEVAEMDDPRENPSQVCSEASDSDPDEEEYGIYGEKDFDSSAEQTDSEKENEFEEAEYVAEHVDEVSDRRLANNDSPIAHLLDRASSIRNELDHVHYRRKAMENDWYDPMQHDQDADIEERQAILDEQKQLSEADRYALQILVNDWKDCTTDALYRAPRPAAFRREMRARGYKFELRLRQAKSVAAAQQVDNGPLRMESEDLEEEAVEDDLERDGKVQWVQDLLNQYEKELHCSPLTLSELKTELFSDQFVNGTPAGIKLQAKRIEKFIWPKDNERAFNQQKLEQRRAHEAEVSTQRQLIANLSTALANSQKAAADAVRQVNAVTDLSELGAMLVEQHRIQKEIDHRKDKLATFLIEARNYKKRKHQDSSAATPASSTSAAPVTDAARAHVVIPIDEPNASPLTVTASSSSSGFGSDTRALLEAELHKHTSKDSLVSAWVSAFNDLADELDGLYPDDCARLSDFDETLDFLIEMLDQRISSYEEDLDDLQESQETVAELQRAIKSLREYISHATTPVGGIDSLADASSAPTTGATAFMECKEDSNVAAAGVASAATAVSTSPASGGWKSLIVLAALDAESQSIEDFLTSAATREQEFEEQCDHSREFDTSEQNESSELISLVRETYQRITDLLRVHCLGHPELDVPLDESVPSRQELPSLAHGMAIWSHWLSQVRTSEVAVEQGIASTSSHVIAPFDMIRIIREIGQDYKNDLIWEEDALAALQTAAEEFAVEHFDRIGVAHEEPPQPPYKRQRRDEYSVLRGLDDSDASEDELDTKSLSLQRDASMSGGDASEDQVNANTLAVECDAPISSFSRAAPNPTYAFNPVRPTLFESHWGGYKVWNPAARQYQLGSLIKAQQEKAAAAAAATTTGAGFAISQVAQASQLPEPRNSWRQNLRSR